MCEVLAVLAKQGHSWCWHGLFWLVLHKIESCLKIALPQCWPPNVGRQILLTSALSCSGRNRENTSRAQREGKTHVEGDISLATGKYSSRYSYADVTQWEKKKKVCWRAPPTWNGGRHEFDQAGRGQHQLVHNVSLALHVGGSTCSSLIMPWLEKVALN